MKKTVIFYTILQTAIAVIFLTFSLAFAGHVSLDKLRTLQALAGTVLPAYPEAEPAFMQALQNAPKQQDPAGKELLSRYGYEEQDYVGKSRSYRHARIVYISMFFIFFIASLSCGYAYFYTAKRNSGLQKAQLLSLLERCLSDDFGFLENKEEPSGSTQDAVPDTFRKLAQKLRLKTEALAEEKDNTKTLVTDISHQLKTPLSALKTCFFLYQEADSPAEAEEFLQRCKTQIEKLEHLTASLINISRLESAMILLKPEPSSLTEILIRAVNAVYDKAAAKQIDIDTDDFPDITLTLDQKWTAEALFNILDNAVKYSPEGSRIQIRVQKLYRFVRLELEDSGIGIPKEEYNQIFKRFYRGKNETVKKTEGSGVGLYLSRRILEDQGGTLSVKAAGKQGSIFVVQLPLSLS